MRRLVEQRPVSTAGSLSGSLSGCLSTCCSSHQSDIGFPTTFTPPAIYSPLHNVC
jgi:hypothetical protein